MRSIIIAALCLLCVPAVQAARPLFQAELDVTNAVEVTAGVAYQISGRVTDRSVMGYDGLSVAVGDLVFSETITGDVDAWQVTNVVASNAVHVTLDVVYQPVGETNLTLEFPAGPAALCTVSETATTGYPQPPSETGAALSAHMLNEIRNYSFRLVPSVGSAQDVGLGELVTNVMDNVAFISNAAPFGATIAAGAADGVTRSGTNLVITWNTNAAGGGTGDASLWYTYPARDRVTFDPLFISNYWATATYNYPGGVGFTGVVDWVDTAKVLADDNDPSTITLGAGEASHILATTNYTFSGSTGAFISAVSIVYKIKGTALANAESHYRFGTNAWGQGMDFIAGSHVIPADYETYTDTWVFASAMSRNDLADFEAGILFTSDPSGYNGFADSLYVTFIGADAWDIGNDANDNFTFASGGSTRLSVSTNGDVTATGDVTGNGVSLADTLARATAGSNLALIASNLAASAYTEGTGAAAVAASVRADFDPTSNTVTTLKGQFDGASSTWFKADGSMPATGIITSSYPVAGRQPGWQMRVSNARLLTNGTTTTLGYDTIVKSNQVTFSTTAFSATPLVPGVYLVTANAWVYGISGAAGSEGRIQIRKAGTVIGRGSFLSAKTATDSYFPTAVAIEYFNGSEACDVNILHAWGNGLTNGADSGMKFTGIMIGTGW